MLKAIEQDRLSMAELSDVPLAVSVARVGQAVVNPKTPEDIEVMVNWARGKSVKLGTSSSSAQSNAPLADLGTIDVLMDLSDMNKVFHVDPDDGVAIIEAGVTFADVDKVLAPQGLRAMKPLLPAAGKSVLASYIEREPLTITREQWDVLDPMGSAQIIFGSGERFYTGNAANQGSMEEHWKSGLRYMTATGPVGTDFLRVMQGSQGTLGVLTWSAIFCDRIPVAEQSFFIADNDQDKLISVMAELNYRRIGSEIFLSNKTHLATVAKACGKSIDAAALPEWVLFANFSANCDLSEDRVAFEVSDLNDITNNAGVKPVVELSGFAASDVIAAHANLPTGDYRDGPTGGHRSVVFLTQADRTPGFVKIARDLAGKHGVNPNDLATYIQPRLQGRNCSIEIMLLTDAGNAGKADAFVVELAQATCDAGGFYSRPYGDWTDMAYEKNPELVPYLRHCKSMFDPDGILHPGRLGL
ncbi:FAD-binding oxidoreductase [Phaeobacter sp. C3_T13_0]|uniref:FAD-binding oxidoreductase n=1 Tax=Phaeobacter cretensis TaxID=3342641 RepID=UPI0039BC36C4